MSLFRKLFYRKPPDGLLEICERVYVFDYCFTTDTWQEENYKSYMSGIVGQLKEHFPDASFLVFNFRNEEKQSQLSSILSAYDMTIMEYPRQYEGSPLLKMEVIHHFLRSGESWLSLGQQNLLLMHCERGGWPVLAFMLAALLLYRKQFNGEHKTLDMIYKQAPRELLQLLQPLNPIPSQLRYLQYVSRRNVTSEWPPSERALTLDCIILRFIPNFDGEGGCRPVFRIYGHNLSYQSTNDMCSTPRKGKTVRAYKQGECELVKIDINCHIQGDVVLECISVNDDMKHEQMMFRAVFNTAFIRSNILILNRDEIDILWDAKDQFPKDFRAEVLFSEMDATDPVVAVDFSGFEEKEGLPVEAFAKVQEIFSSVDWSDSKTDVALNVLQQMSASNVVQENFDTDLLLSVQLSPRSPGSPRRLEMSPRMRQERKKRMILDTSMKNSMSSTQKGESELSPKSPPGADVVDEAEYKDFIFSRLSDLMRQKLPQSPLRSTISPFSSEDAVTSGITRKIASRAASDQTLSVLPGTEPEPVVNSTPSKFLPASPSHPQHLSVSEPVDPILTRKPESYGQVSSATTQPGLDSLSTLPLPLPLPPTTPSKPETTPPVPPLKDQPAINAGPPPPPTPPLKDQPIINAGPPVPPPPPTPPLNEADVIRARPPPPLPPPLHSREEVNLPVSSKMPPPPPPPSISSSNSFGVPSAPPPPLPFGKGISKMGTNADNSSHSPSPAPPTPAPPFSSPSSMKGRLSRTISSKSNQTKKLKPLHWLKLTRAVQGSLWAETQKSGEAKAPEIDLLELENLFSASAPNSDQGQKSRALSLRGTKPDKVQLIDHRRAYNCEIMLSKVKVPLNELMNSVLSLEDSALDVDQVENLIKFCPTKEEMELLKGYTGEKEKLGKCEQFFLELMEVPRVESKLRVFSFKIQFHFQVSDLRKSLNVVNSTAEEIRNSTKLKRIMQTILSLGNALNQGTARGSAIGFRLDSLLKLTETRARNNKMTLMHYLCKVLADKLPEVLDFSKDLPSLEPASKIQLKYLAEEMQAISKGLEKVVQELSTSESDGPISANFHKILKEFLRFAEAEVRSLASLYSGVGRNVDALILYFGEDPARCPFEQVVSTLLNFVRLFNKANEENCKQLEMEMRKAVQSGKSIVSQNSESLLRARIGSGDVK